MDAGHCANSIHRHRYTLSGIAFAMVVHGNGVVPLLAIMYINYAIAWMCGSVRFLGPALCWMFNIGLLALRGTSFMQVVV